MKQKLVKSLATLQDHFVDVNKIVDIVSGGLKTSKNLKMIKRNNK